MTGRNPGHFFKEFEKIGITGKAQPFLNFGYGLPFCQHTLGEIHTLDADIMSDGCVRVLFKQSPQIVFVQMEFCCNKIKGKRFGQVSVDKRDNLVHVFLGL